jgi:hypothetical protein
MDSSEWEEASEEWLQQQHVFTEAHSSSGWMALHDMSSMKVTMKLSLLALHVCTLKPMIPMMYHSSTIIAKLRMPTFRLISGKNRNFFHYICILYLQ